MNRKQSTFSTNQNTPHSHPGPIGAGPAGPPRNMVTNSADIVMTFMNSARKNNANRIELYSVLKPPTSSCSASTRSNGGRFSSAVPAMTNTMNGTTAVITNPQLGTQPNGPGPAWNSTMSCVPSVPVTRTTATTDR